MSTSSLSLSQLLTLSDEALYQLLRDHNDTIDLTLSGPELLDLAELLKAAREELANRHSAGGWDPPTSSIPRG